MRLQKGNRKLPKCTGIFNLPAIKTCPKATENCKKWCYARKAEKMYPNVLPFREENFKISLQKDFKDKIINELKTRYSIKTIRISESGDFYNQEYLDKWIEIAKEFKDIIYAYTKSIHLDFNKKPDNMIIIYSDDKKDYSLKELKSKGFNGRARVVEKNAVIGKNEFRCPGSCKECNYCYTEPKKFKQVVFEKH